MGIEIARFDRDIARSITESSFQSSLFKGTVTNYNWRLRLELNDLYTGFLEAQLFFNLC